MSVAMWRVKSPATLCRHQWGEAHFIFDPASGQTHYLNELAAQIIRLLSIAALSADGIYSYLLETYSVEDDADLLRAINMTLKQLDELGVVMEK